MAVDSAFPCFLRLPALGVVLEPVLRFVEVSCHGGGVAGELFASFDGGLHVGVWSASLPRVGGVVDVSAHSIPSASHALSLGRSCDAYAQHVELRSP